jgi:rhodanese-related sulfurtransferase
VVKIIIILALLIFGWDFAWYVAGVKPIFPWQLKRRLNSSKKDAKLIDVRTRFEFNWFHIKGAENHPVPGLDPTRLDKMDKEKPVVVICLSGHRSPGVVHRLKKLGFKEVYNLTWGMLFWKLLGGSTVKSCR